MSKDIITDYEGQFKETETLDDFLQLMDEVSVEMKKKEAQSKVSEKREDVLESNYTEDINEEPELSPEKKKEMMCNLTTALTNGAKEQGMIDRRAQQAKADEANKKAALDSKKSPQKTKEEDDKKDEDNEKANKKPENVIEVDGKKITLNNYSNEIEVPSYMVYAYERLINKYRTLENETEPEKKEYDKGTEEGSQVGGSDLDTTTTQEEKANVIKRPQMSEWAARDLLGNLLWEGLRTALNGKSRITSVLIQKRKIVVNGVVYEGRLPDEMVAKILPCLSQIDREALLAKRYANFIDFGNIATCVNLKFLSIDDVDFLVRKVTIDMEINPVNIVPSLFKSCRKLELLTIGGKKFTRNGDVLEGKTSLAEIEERAKSLQKVDTLYNRLAVNTTRNVRKYTTNNLVTYAKNREKRGIIRFTGGVLARTGLAAVAGTVSLGALAVGKLVNKYDSGYIGDGSHQQKLE